MICTRALTHCARAFRSQRAHSSRQIEGATDIDNISIVKASARQDTQQARLHHLRRQVGPEAGQQQAPEPALPAPRVAARGDRLHEHADRAVVHVLQLSCRASHGLQAHGAQQGADRESGAFQFLQRVLPAVGRLAACSMPSA